MSRYLAAGSATDNPWMLVVAGLAGAGKGAFTREAIDRCREFDGCVVADACELLFQHPDFLAGFATASHECIRDAEESCRQLAWSIWAQAVNEGKNVILESRLDDDRVLSALDQAGDVGYRRVLLFVVADPNVATDAVHSRAERWREIHGDTRENTPEQLQHSFATLRTNLAAILERRLVDELFAVSPDGKLLSIATPDSWVPAEIVSLLDRAGAPTPVKTFPSSAAGAAKGRKIKLGDFGTAPVETNRTFALSRKSKPKVESASSRVKIKLGDFTNTSAPRPVQPPALPPPLPPTTKRPSQPSDNDIDVAIPPNQGVRETEPALNASVKSLPQEPPAKPTALSVIAETASTTSLEQTHLPPTPKFDPPAPRTTAAAKRRLLLEKLRRWAHPE